MPAARPGLIHPIMVLGRPTYESNGRLVLGAASGTLFRSRVGAIVNLHYVFDGKLRVALRCREPLVAQQFLDGAQICTSGQHVRAERMTQRVGMNVRRQSFCSGDFFDDAPHAARGQSSSTLVY